MRAAHWMIPIAIAIGLYRWSALSSAQNLTPQGVIEDRIANFRKIGKAFKHIRDELRGQNPSIPLIQDSAQEIESLGGQIISWFPAGSDEGDTHAKKAVWTDRVTFEQAQRKFHAEAQKMTQVAQSGDKEALTSQYKTLGKACKNCHDTFRGKVEDNL